MTEDFVSAFEQWNGTMLDFFQKYTAEELATELGVPVKDAALIRIGECWRTVPISVDQMEAMLEEGHGNRVVLKGKQNASKTFRAELVAAIHNEGVTEYADRILEEEISRLTGWLSANGVDV